MQWSMLDIWCTYSIYFYYVFYVPVEVDPPGIRRGLALEGREFGRQRG